MIPDSKQGGYPWDVWQAAMEAVADIHNEVDHPTDIIAQTILKVLASRLPRQDDEIRKAALEEAANDPSVLDRVASAIDAARYPDREGPYGLYDYTGHTGGAHKPYCVRDFRDPRSDDYGAFVLCTDDRDEAAALYGRLTREHIAAAAIRALSQKGDEADG